MAHDDPFTIDLFGNTALASGFDLGVSGFAADFGTDIDIDPQPSTLAPAAPVRKEPKPKTQMRAKVDFRLQGSRGLAKSWRDRARDNIAAILLAGEIERHGLAARPDQQARLIKFTGFGASDLANGIFRRPGEDAFRKGWEDLGGNLESAVTKGDYGTDHVIGIGSDGPDPPACDSLLQCPRKLRAAHAFITRPTPCCRRNGPCQNAIGRNCHR